MLPKWAQLLDLATELCAVSKETRRWFAAFTNKNGVDDALTILAFCDGLKLELLAAKERALAELRRADSEAQALLIYEAWIYSLDTMIQQADGKKTCSWIIEDNDKKSRDDFGGGEITLRRV